MVLQIYCEFSLLSYNTHQDESECLKKAMIEKSEPTISKMFNQISPTYDRVNRILSFGIDQVWRKRLVAKLPKLSTLKLLDVATGTCDQLMLIMEEAPCPIHAIGIDIAEEMIKLGSNKIKEKPYADKVHLQIASAAKLPFPDGSFDCITLSFGIRNMEEIALCLSEMHRVLKKGGRLLILEFSLPSNKIIRALSLFYLRYLLPKVGGWISKNKAAYSYLDQTIENFPYGKPFCNLLEQAGFIDVAAHPLTFGIASLYQGDRG